MHWTNISEVAWVGDALLQGPITGVLVSFHGLGFTGVADRPNGDEYLHAQQGLLCVFPYYGPWSWMNREARGFVDDLIAVTYHTYQLPADTPLLLRGGSMGGGSALLYARYAAHPIAGVLADCPVCDAVYHFRERPDVARTMYHAFGAYSGDWPAILKEHSALHQVAALPNVPYFIVHGDADTAVSKAHHSDLLVPAMRACGLEVEYYEVPGMAHCAPWPEELIQRGREFLWSTL